MSRVGYIESIHVSIISPQPFLQLQPVMHKLLPSKTSHILSLLTAGVSGHEISKETDVSTAAISRLHSKHLPNLPKLSGGCPSILSTANLDYARCMIKMGKIDNAAQAAQALKNIIKKPVSAQTMC